MGMEKNQLTRNGDTGYREHLTQARSSGGEHHLDAVGVQGSNPCVPTIFFILILIIYIHSLVIGFDW